MWVKSEILIDNTPPNTAVEVSDSFGKKLIAAGKTKEVPAPGGVGAKAQKPEPQQPKAVIPALEAASQKKNHPPQDRSSQKKDR